MPEEGALLKLTGEEGEGQVVAHRVDGRKLGRATDHRLALFRNLVTDLEARAHHHH